MFYLIHKQFKDPAVSNPLTKLFVSEHEQEIKKKRADKLILHLPTEFPINPWVHVHKEWVKWVCWEETRHLSIQTDKLSQSCALKLVLY